MHGLKTQAQTRPTALGTMLQASTYGAAIPTIYGTTLSSFLVIWVENLRVGSCLGKKKKSKKKGAQTYVENIDFLIGSNPIDGLLQIWSNAVKYGLNFVKQDFSTPSTRPQTLTITDPNFYFLVALTVDVNNVGTFNDYGSNGSPISYNDTSEYALFNIAQHGPDLIDASYSKFYPFLYKWAPSDGTTIYLPIGPHFFAPTWGIPNGLGTFHAYYAQLTAATKFQAPSARLCLTFEPTLGDGSEYTGFTSQQIKYPEYAGAGSPDIDLGSSGSIPSIRPEVRGSFARFAPRGDADFCDMIEDTIKSGMLQTGAQLGLIQRGVNLNELPGAVQKMQTWASTSPHDTSVDLLGFQQPIAAGTVMLAFARWRPNSSGVDLTISDTAAQSWTPVFVTDHSGLFYAIASTDIPAGDNVAIIFDGGLGSTFDLQAACWTMDPGSNAIDAAATASGTGGSALCSVTVTGEPVYIIAAVNSDSGFTTSPPDAPPHWADLFPTILGPNGIYGAGMVGRAFICYRIVAAPGTYTFSIPVSGGSNWQIGLIAIKASQPVPYPKALGNILDKDSLDLVRAQCQAAGLWGSVAMSSQQAATDWLKQFYQCANADPLWSGFVLKSIPRSEVSAVGNGVVYTSPTAAGPVATLTEADLVGDPSGPLITVERKAQVDANNILQVQYFDRNSDYNQSSASEPMSGAIALFGPRKEAPILLSAIQDPLVARKILAIEVRRRTLLRNVYSFKMKAQWAALEATDLILINDSKVGIANLPVRLTKIVENDKFELECEAEPFVYGCHAPDPAIVATVAAPYSPGTGGDPGSVNTPIIFEPIPRLTGQQNQAQVWAVVSGSSADYGGCVVLLSTDGGSSYKTIGQIVGNAATGYTVGDWPIANDPDTTNDLAVDLTESLGTLATHSVSDEDAFVYPCYVAPGLSCIAYELMAYAVATLTAANKYTIKATGGGTNHLRRAVFSAPQAAAGVDHPDNSRFAFLDPTGAGIFKLNMDPLWIGQTLHFKFLAVNKFGLQAQDASAATDYTYTPTGCPSAAQNPNNNYVNTPAVSLSQTTATHVAMAQASVQFPSNKANYNARGFTITDPGGTPTVYYVTIYDPAQLGDKGTGTALTAYCETSNAKVGQPGYTYMGFIQATHLITDPLNIAGPGGWPPPQMFEVGA